MNIRNIVLLGIGLLFFAACSGNNPIDIEQTSEDRVPLPEENTAPKIAVYADSTDILVGSRVLFTGTAEDPDGSVKKILFKTTPVTGVNPAEGFITQNTNNFQISVTFDSAGTFTTTFWAEDNEGKRSDGVPIAISVRKPQDPLITPPTVRINSSATQVNAPDSIRLTIQIEGDATEEGLSITPEEGRIIKNLKNREFEIVFPVTGTASRTYLVRYFARNAAGEGSDQVAIEVTEKINTLPTLTIGSDKNEGDAPLTVNFTATASDADGDPLTFVWDFDDGSENSQKQNPTHTFTNPGTYNVSCTVSDGKVSVTRNRVITVFTSDKKTFIKVFTEPSEADIWLIDPDDELNGGSLGKSPTLLTEIQPGEYTVVAKLEGYISADTLVTAEEGDTLIVRMNLEKIPDPPQPDVCVDVSVPRTVIRIDGTRRARLKDEDGNPVKVAVERPLKKLVFENLYSETNENQSEEIMRGILVNVETGEEFVSEPIPDDRGGIKQKEARFNEEVPAGTYYIDAAHEAYFDNSVTDAPSSIHIFGFTYCY